MHTYMISVDDLRLGWSDFGSASVSHFGPILLIYGLPTSPKYGPN